MRNPIPYKVQRENLKFFSTTQRAYGLGLVTHAASIFLFWWLGITELVYFNAIISVPFFALAFVLNRLGRHSLAFFFAFFELYVHQAAGIYLVGWDYGFQFWLVCLGALSFFNPHWKNRTKVLLLILVSAGFLLLHLFVREGVYTLDRQVLTTAYLSNALFAIMVFSLLVHYFATAATRAEKELEAEKERTEAKNEQLMKQHESLLIEQDKTSGMLNKIASLFGQQVSREIADEMIQSESEIDSKTYEATIMFMDIRNFTVFADSREPAEVARFQNIVFGELIDIVRVHRGVVLQILGDGIMAVFGAPVVDERHAHNAIQAGYAMLEKVQELGDNKLIPPTAIGIGLNTGSIIAGNVGNETRKFYSLTGKPVIIAARIEQLNKKYGSRFLVSDSVFARVRHADIHYEDLGSVNLKGIEQSMAIYKLG